MSVTPPAPACWGPLLPHAPAPPPLPVRTAILLVWVKVGVGVLAAILLLAVPGLHEHLLAPAQDTPDLAARSEGVVVGAVVTLTVVVALWVAIVVLLFLPASRWWLSERTAQRQRDRRLPRGPAERW